MSDGYQKQRLTQYLNGAREGAIGSAGDDWKARGMMLEAVSEALMKKGPELSEKLGTTSQTAAELKSSLLKSAQSMNDTGGKLKEAGDALVVVGDNLEKARVSRKAMKSLIEPPPFTAPNYNGAQPTPGQIQQEADQRAASNAEHSSYQTAHAGQEAEAAEITANLDQAFLSAIPAMVAIHGGPDPTAPTPGDKDGPGTNVPPPVNRTSTPGVHREYAIFADEETAAERREREEREREEREERERRDREQREQQERERQRQRELAERERLEQERLERERLERERLERERLERLRQQDTTYTPKHPTTNVQGGTDSGASYHVVSDGSSVSGSASSTSAGVGGAAAAGAAGVGLGAGAMKGGSAAAPVGGTVRGIGVGGQAGASSSISRGPAGAGARGGAVSGTSAAGRSTAAGSASRSAGAGGRAGVAGSSSTSRGTAAGKGAAGRGAAGSTSGKGSAKGKGKGLFRRGSSVSTAGGRSDKLGDDRNTPRDALVYEQDWLGDETAAPSVLD